jgi:hypothetical protein
MRHQVWHLYVDTAVEGSELYCHNTKGDRNSVVRQALCRMDVTRLEQHTNIKTALLRHRERNARECHRELVEAVGNNALPYRTSLSQYGYFVVGTLF